MHYGAGLIKKPNFISCEIWLCDEMLSFWKPRMLPYLHACCMHLQEALHEKKCKKSNFRLEFERKSAPYTQTIVYIVKTDRMSLIFKKKTKGSFAWNLEVIVGGILSQIQRIRFSSSDGCKQANSCGVPWCFGALIWIFITCLLVLIYQKKKIARTASVNGLKLIKHNLTKG